MRLSGLPRGNVHAVDGAADKSPRQQVLEDEAAKAEVDEALQRGGDRENRLEVGKNGMRIGKD